MKKAKIFLTTIIVLALVGGALAFKAGSYNLLYAYTCIDGNSCTILKDDLGVPINVKPAGPEDVNPIVAEQGVLVVNPATPPVYGCDLVCTSPGPLAVTVE